MEINYLLIACAVILLACIIRGARKGMLRIIFGIIAWVFLICFINYGSGMVASYIQGNTDIPISIQQNIGNHLHERYNSAEEKEAGTGEEAVLSVVPNTIKNEIVESIQESIDATIGIIAEELTSAAIKGISTILCVIIGIFIIFVVDKIIKALGFVPGVRDVNRLFGMLAGLFEGLLVIWVIMYIADCFPASAVGRFVINNLENDQLLIFIYQNNIIKEIIEI